jgi:hypothetical protein
MICSTLDSNKKKKEVGPVLVIPLIKENQWKGGALSGNTAPASSVSDPPTLSNASAPPDSSTIPTILEGNHSADQKKWGLKIMASAGLKPAKQILEQLVEAPQMETNPLRSLEEEALDAILNGEQNTVNSIATDPIYSKPPVIIKESDGIGSEAVVLPILQQNAVPGLAELTDAKEKYLHDMALRPDNVQIVFLHFFVY